MISNKKIKTALDKINAIKHIEEDVFAVFKDVCFDFNIEQFALAVFSGKKKITESFYVYDTYPKAWVKHYKEKQYHLCDPIFNTLQKVALPFEWSTESFENLLPIQQILMEESYDFGIKSGITIPLIPQPTFHSFVTVINKSALHYDVLYTLSFVGNICSNKVVSLREEKDLAIKYG